MVNDESADLIIAYAGEALDDGTMDVQDLAPALLAIGDLINECNKVLNNKEEKIQIKIKSDFKKGSFQTTIVIVKSFIDQFMIAAGPAIELKEILDLIGFFGDGLIALIKNIKGRKIEKARQVSDGNVELVFENGSNPVITNLNIYNIYKSIPVQDSVNRMVKPLKQEGITGFYTAFEGKHMAEISNKEAEYFRTPQIVVPEKEDELILKSEYIGVYNVVTAQFEEGYKWRLSNGQDKISASLLDEAFARRIDDGEVSISKEDIFKVKIRTTQWQKSDGMLKTENEIIAVIEHIKPGKFDQLQIPFEN